MVFAFAAEPKMAKLTISGPMVVPKLLIPPASVKRCEPVLMGPKAIASGLATVCCKEKPKATINKPESINGKE
ncbi:hypothetical protein D3C73_1244300 [compost metagenome]